MSKTNNDAQSYEVGTAIADKSKPTISSEVQMNDAVATSESTDVKPQISSNTANLKKKIIKDGNISVKTRDIVSSKNNIDSLLKSLDAYYENEDAQNSDYEINYSLKIRVPANNFEKLIASIETGNDEIINKSIQARDITAEFFDIETRLANKREYLNRYKALLSKAGTIKDILAIEENIRTLVEEIESNEGRLKLLGDQVAFSTLMVSLVQQKDFVYKPQQKDRFWERVKKSIENGWNKIIEFLLFLISIWPFIILGILAFLGFKRFKKPKTNKNDQQN